MTTDASTVKPDIPIGTVLIAGLMSGALGAVLANLYHALYLALTGNRFAELSLVSITLASLVPSLIGAFVYVALTRFTARATVGFTVLGLAVAVLSTLPQFIQPLHPGFALAAAPLHLIVAATAVALIPRLLRR